MVMARRGVLDDIACLVVKDRASMVVSKNIKLYRPLAITDCDHFVHKIGKKVSPVRLW